jgi:hypothetical protein
MGEQKTWKRTLTSQIEVMANPFPPNPLNLFFPWSFPGKNILGILDIQAGKNQRERVSESSLGLLDIT